MGSLINPKPWVPYLNVKDCSQGFCSLYCPQWCYTIFPPPPPIELPNDNPGPNFSPLIIAIILILASGFLIVSYYAIISKYFGNNNSSRPMVDHDTNEDPLSLESWHVANDGLNEALIKSIAVYNYKRGHNLIEGTDCSVCLSEFEEDESLRLLPKCNHAFHVACIDTWLKSHSNCPLCRANIVNISPPLSPAALENEAIIEDINTGTIRGEEILHNGEISKEENIEVVIEIGDEKFKQVRRSLSMDFDCGERLSIGDVLLLKQDYRLRNDGVGSSNRKLSEISKLSKDMGLCVDNTVLMKRSFSSERFSFSRRGKQRIVMIS